MRDMIAQPSAPQTVEIHQASPGFATPLEAAKLLRLSRAMGHELIGERKMPAYRYGRAVRIPLDVAYPDWEPSMKIWTTRNRMQGFERESRGETV